MPSFTPTLKDAEPLALLVGHIGKELGRDAWFTASLPGAFSLKGKLESSIEDIGGSLIEADEVDLSDDEAAALLYFGSQFSPFDNKSAVSVVGRICREIYNEKLIARISNREIAPNKLTLTARKATKIFLIHGRDRQALLEIRHWLKEECGLQVSIMEVDKAEGSQALAEAVEQKMAGCGTAIVIASPDDVGAFKQDQEKLAPRARQNVILELGWLIGLIGRSRVILLLHESLVPDFPSDLAGVTTIRFLDDLRNTFDGLRQKLQSMGVIVIQPKHK